MKALPVLGWLAVGTFLVAAATENVWLAVGAAAGWGVGLALAWRTQR